MVTLADKDVLVVQSKAHRLGMYLLGQALFSRLLIEERFAPRSVRAVALCARDDAVLHPLAERCGIEVVIDKRERSPYGMNSSGVAAFIASTLSGSAADAYACALALSLAACSFALSV